MRGRLAIEVPGLDGEVPSINGEVRNLDGEC
uniref:Uncharacterized protein n=1 Tax=Candidatus Kentrum sp. TC TaxID=2126339 RepID=A0A450YNG2_9GAMM|nr:MAG: hypothetical protein BECKTC1821E_GA0114239_10234 [Candidatus Kentron sp. TC]